MNGLFKFLMVIIVCFLCVMILFFLSFRKIKNKFNLIVIVCFKIRGIVLFSFFVSGVNVRIINSKLFIVIVVSVIC